MTPRRRARALLATVVAALAAGAALAWTPPTFATFCGEPAAYAWEDPAQAVAAFYAAQGSDPDVRGDPDCLPAARRQSIERSFGDALGWLRRLAFPATPAPGRLGPVFADVAGEPRVRVFLDDDAATADVLACWGTRDLLGLIRFGVTFARGLNRLDDRFVAAHELVHVVQGAQQLFRAASCEPGLPMWVTEGTADALAGAYLRQRVPGFRPSLGGYGPAVMGLRGFDASLTAADAPSLPGGRETERIYRTSSLFTFVAERWNAGGMDLWARAMATPAPVRDDGLAWIDAVLRDPALGVGQPLALVFPSFLASYADWGTTRWPHVGEAVWRHHAFGGCLTASLTPANPSFRLELDLENLAGACLEVRVSGLAGDQLAVVNAIARAPDVEGIDDLHLGFVRSDGRLYDPFPRDCELAEVLAPPAAAACVVQPWTGRRDARPGVPGFARIWPGETIYGGNPSSELLVFARAPADPTDVLHGNRTPKTYAIAFALETATVAVDGRSVGPVYASANFGAPGFAGPPRWPGDGETNAIDPSRMMFGQQLPGVASFAAAPAGGIYQIQFIEGDDLHEDGIRRAFGVELLDASIPFRAVGTFFGRLTGVDVTRPSLGSLIVATEPARVTVEAWTDDHVKLRVDATWCYNDEIERDERSDLARCRVERAFAATVWLPFGDGYDGDTPFASVDSPVQELYREVFARGVGFDVDALFTPPPALGGAPPSLELVGTIGQCFVTCMAEFSRCDE